ncbi:sensor domain-containing diguanylate cyclase [Altericroceibacterium spongiae]|nr:diguanylate cyclase [Altericroceibacterium spongiae]
MAGAGNAAEPLYQKSCLLAGERPVDIRIAKQKSSWNCSPDIGDANYPYVWIRVDARNLTSDYAGTEDLRLASDAMAFEGLQLHMEFTDGSSVSRYYDSRAIAQNFGAGTWFTLPLKTNGKPLSALYVRVDRPMGSLVTRMMELDRGAAADAEKLTAMIVFALIVGMMLLAAFYSVSLFVVMHARFVLYHAFIAILLTIYTVASSSLIFVFFPETTLWVRSILSYGAAAMSMAMLVPFLFSFLEREAVAPVMRWLGLAFFPLACFAAIFVPLFGREMAFGIRPIYHLFFVPGALLFVALCIQAWRRNSRAVQYVILAWALPIAMAVERVFRGLNLYSAPVEWDFGFYVAMGYEAIVMVMAVAWRVSQLRGERDKAVASHNELTVLAETDGLTGLPNRRSFDQQEWMHDDHLVLLDVDHFKKVNDRYGHLIGDAVLKVIGRELAAAVEDRVLVRAWRLGGEEFGALIVGRSGDVVSEVLDGLRQAISETIASEVPVLEDPVTMSAGLAQTEEGSLPKTYRSADAALYRAKGLGRNRICYSQNNGHSIIIFERPAAA